MIVTTLDTETTGLLSSPFSRAIEIGMVKHNIETGEILSKDGFFVRPGDEVMPYQDFSIPEKFCGIQKNQILDGIHYVDALRRISSFAGGSTIWCWNFPFDQRMVFRYVEDAIHYREDKYDGLQIMRDIRWGGCWQRMYAMHMRNTDFGSRYEDGNVKLVKLEKAIEIEGYDVPQNHRAVDDAIASAFVVHKMFERTPFKI